MKNLLLFLLLVPMVSFGQTKIGFGTQTSSYDVTVRDNSLAPSPIGSERKYRVDVETSRVPKRTVFDPSAELDDFISTLNAQEKQREAKRQSWDAAAQRMGYSSGREYYFAQKAKQQKIIDYRRFQRKERRQFEKKQRREKREKKLEKIKNIFRGNAYYRSD